MNTQRPSAAGIPTLILRTGCGEIRVAARAGKIISCALPFQPLEKSAPKISSDWKIFAVRGSRMINAGSHDDSRALVAADHFIRALFAGESAPLPPVALPDATEFTQKIWKQLLAIPFGQTRSYSEIARAAGRPLAARAAGSACGANQIPLFIPCHRVLGAGGALGGFSCGLPWKKFLLHCEGVAP